MKPGNNITNQYLIDKSKKIPDATQNKECKIHFVFRTFTFIDKLLMFRFTLYIILREVKKWGPQMFSKSEYSQYSVHL